jgi:glycosyltransferase involved in cell wall biosynthesis
MIHTFALITIRVFFGIMSKPTLSVTIITCNEEHDIRACLESVRWADEIIVLDSGSTDNTVAICREYTDKVFSTDWPGFGQQKNRALQYVTTDWVLSLDADEQVTPELQQEIATAIQNGNHDAYAIPRQSIYCGTVINYGAWHKKPVVRLFKCCHGKFDDAPVHESLIIDGEIGTLKSLLIHHTYRNLEEVLDKMNLYSTKKAEHLLQQGKKGSLVSAITHGFWAFFRSFILQRGFLDGKAGYMLAISNAQYAYYCYLKLMQLGKRS